MLKRFASSVAGASIFIAFFGLLSKGLGFLREVIFASIFGLSTEFDIYLVAAVLPLTINMIIMTIGQNYLIPAYNNFKQVDSSKAIKFIQSNLVLFFFAGLFLSAILYSTSNQLLSIFIQNSDLVIKQTAVDIFNLFLITIPITCGISVLSAYQQGNFEFRFSILSQIIPNIIVILALFTLKDLNVYAIPIGYVAGTILQFLFLIITSKELIILEKDFLFSFGNLINSLSLSVIVVILIESVGHLYLIADRFFYEWVEPGGVSSLSYAQTLFLLPVSIISIALSTAIFPKFSKLFSIKDYNGLEKVFNDGLSFTIIFFVPVMFIFLFYGDVIIKILFERGKFSSGETIITFSVLSYLALSIIFYAAYGILNKFLYSSGMINQLLLITILGIALKIILNFYFVSNMQQDGLALSTSLSFLFFFIASITAIHKKKFFISKISFLNELLFHLFNAILSLLIIRQFSVLYSENTFFALIEMCLFLLIFITNLFLLKFSSTRIILDFISTFKR
jgi:putative peptidoglycan lipid II flippase